MRYRTCPALVLLVLIAFGSQNSQGAIVTRTISNVELNGQASDEYSLDVDLDGNIDFYLQTFFSNDTAFLLGFDQVKVSFGSTNGLAVRTSSTDGFPSASLLISGDIVGPSSIFSAGSNDTTNLFSSDPFQGATGEFGGKRGSLGFRFDSGGTFRYGFADVAVNDLNSSSPFNLTLYGVSYDDAGVPITITAIPEPTAFALVGFAMLASFFRLRRAAQTTSTVAGKFERQ